MCGAPWKVVAVLALAVVANAVGGMRDGVSDTSMLQVHVRQESTIIHEAEGLSTSKSKLKKAYPYYHTSDELRAETMRLASNCADGQLSMRTVNKSDATFGDVFIDVVHVKAKGGGEATNRFFMVCGEHSRELISSESCLYMMRALCGEAEIGGSETGAQALANTEFQLVLNSNPRSRSKVEAGAFCLRTNPADVDLNRNWDEKWQSAQTAMDDTNPGPKPFSEPETQILKEAVTKFRPTSFLSVHSGTRGLYMPWAYNTKASFLEKGSQDISKAGAMMDVLRQVDADHCECPFGPAGKEVGYNCPGTSLDWAFDHLTNYSFAYEIYTDHGMDKSLRQRWLEKRDSGGTALLEAGHHLAHPHFQDVFEAHTSDFVQLRQQDTASIEDALAHQCFGTYNPETKEDYDSVVRNWAAAYLQTARLVAEDIQRKAGVGAVKY